MDALISKAININNILSEYIEIHDEVFKSSLRRLIPIPGLFSAIDFGKHLNKLGKLEDELMSIISDLDEINELSRILVEYTNNLHQSIVLFRVICKNLYNKSQGVNSYTYKKYRTAMKEYEISVETYKVTGGRLNYLLRPN